MQGGVHHAQRHQGDVGRALLAHDPRAEGACVPGREARPLAEAQAGVVREAGALHAQRRVVVPEAQVVEPDPADVTGLIAQGAEFPAQRLLGLRRREGAVQRHLGPRGAHCGGQVPALPLVRAPWGAVQPVGVAADQEHRGPQPAPPGGLEEVRHVVPGVMPGEVAHGPVPPSLDRAGDAPRRPPPDAVDVVREEHGPGLRCGNAERVPQGSQVPLGGRLLDVQPRDGGEGAAGVRQPAEAVAIRHPVFIPPGQQVEGAGHDVARYRRGRVGRGEEKGESPRPVHRIRGERPGALEEGLGGVLQGDPARVLIRGRRHRRVHDVRGPVGEARLAAESLGQGGQHPPGAWAERRACALDPDAQRVPVHRVTPRAERPAAARAMRAACTRPGRGSEREATPSITGGRSVAAAPRAPQRPRRTSPADAGR